MEFDIGNILYVVITLVAIIASLLGKKKKPANKNAKPGFFENLEQVLKMGQEDPVLTDLQEHEPDLQEEDPAFAFLNDEEPPVPEQAATEEEPPGIYAEYEGSSIKQFQQEDMMAIEPMELIHLDEDEDPDYFEIVRDFDAGTAVVYSAIINRVNY